MMDVPVAGTHAIDLAAEPPLRVGHATIDPLSHEAEFGGHRERLQPQNLKVLIALARKRGQVVKRDELVQLCWDGRFIGDDVINRAISTLRQFAERAGGFTIETVPRAGYRLTDESAAGRRHPRLWIAGSAMLMVACLAAVLIYAWPRRPSSAAPPTIALLPFSAATSEPQMHELASATHDALAHTLSQGAFAVTVLDSMPQSRSPAADFVISGEVTASPEKIVTTVRMDETAHHYVVFSHQFEAALKDASGLPAEVGAQVAAQISWVEPLLMVERRHPTDPAIIASVLQSSAAGLVGTGLLNDYERSERLAVQAPNSPLAQASFANNTAFVLDELPREERAAAVAAGRRAAERSLAIAPEFGAGYFAWSLLQNNLAWGAGEDKLRAGMRADPEAPFLGF